MLSPVSTLGNDDVNDNDASDGGSWTGRCGGVAGPGMAVVCLQDP